jgi:hypothetical protein
VYTVTWRDPALDQLAELYVSLSVEERERLAAAVAALNERLRHDPIEVGESRTRGFRLTFLPHASVAFHVDVKTNQVRVKSVVF